MMTLLAGSQVSDRLSALNYLFDHIISSDSFKILITNQVSKEKRYTIVSTYII